MQKFRVNQAAKILDGSFAGLAGNVEEAKAVAGEYHYKLHIHGVRDGESVDHRGWFEEDQLEVLK